MGSFHLTGMSLKNLFKKPATKMYPIVPVNFTDKSKGHIENDMDTCILCSLCAKICPTNAIEVDKAKGSWTINKFDCIQCYSCVRGCPKKSLSMNPEYQKAAVKKSSVSVLKTNLETKK